MTPPTPTERARFEARQAMADRARERAFPWIIEGTDKVKPMHSTELIQMLYSHEIAAAAEPKADGWQERVNALVTDLIDYGQTVGAFDNAALASGAIKALIAKHSSAALAPYVTAQPAPSPARTEGTPIELTDRQALAIAGNTIKRLRQEHDTLNMRHEVALIDHEETKRVLGLARAEVEKINEYLVSRKITEMFPGTFAALDDVAVRYVADLRSQLTARQQLAEAKQHNTEQQEEWHKCETELATLRTDLTEARAEVERLKASLLDAREAKNRFKSACSGLAAENLRETEELHGQLSTLRTLASDLAGALEKAAYAELCANSENPPCNLQSILQEATESRDAALARFRSSTPAPAPAPDKPQPTT